MAQVFPIEEPTILDSFFEMFFGLLEFTWIFIYQLFILMGIPLIWICLALLSLLPIPIGITEIELEPYYFWAGFIMFMAILIFKFEFLNNPRYKFKEKEKSYHGGRVEPIIIEGIKGMGKTQSAMQMMYDFNSQYPNVLATAKEVELGKNDAHVIDTQGNKYLFDTKRKLNWHTLFTSPAEKVLVNPPNPKNSLFEKSMEEERKQLSWEESLIYGDTDTEIHTITESTPENYDNTHQQRMYNDEEYRKKYNNMRYGKTPEGIITPAELSKKTLLLEFAPKHPQPTSQFYCAIGMEYHDQNKEVYICLECERYVCDSCFEDMKEVGATNCPYCQNELVKCKP